VKKILTILRTADRSKPSKLDIFSGLSAPCTARTFGINIQSEIQPRLYQFHFTRLYFHVLLKDILSFFRAAFSVGNPSFGISSSISADYKDAVQLCEVFAFPAFHESDTFLGHRAIFNPSFKQ